jgi:IMP and pyridine-specific 5'-nucleotidase
MITVGNIKFHSAYAPDVLTLISVAHQNANVQDNSKLKLLVPSVATFFTPLFLYDAFVYQDTRRFISYRRFVAPSFNDVRLILNTAQVMSLVKGGNIELLTFDGDVTLYDDGHNLTPENAVIPRILRLIAKGTRIGIVTAAGYTEGRRYYQRLYGLLDALHASTISTTLKQNLIVLGGESNYCFKYSAESPDLLQWIPRKEWLLPQMLEWAESDISALLDVAEVALRDCIKNMRLAAQVIRKERAVGIIPEAGGHKFAREQLEETVLVTQKILEMSEIGRRVPFCAFNGGNDVFVDIGDKSWGVRACQKFFGGIEGGKTLHVGDQFLSAGANDFKARMACTTAWIASPAETCALLDEIEELDELVERKTR